MRHSRCTVQRGYEKRKEESEREKEETRNEENHFALPLLSTFALYSYSLLLPSSRSPQCCRLHRVSDQDQREERNREKRRKSRTLLFPLSFRWTSFLSSVSLSVYFRSFLPTTRRRGGGGRGREERRKTKENKTKLIDRLFAPFGLFVVDFISSRAPLTLPHRYAQNTVRESHKMSLRRKKRITHFFPFSSLPLHP